MPPTMFSFLASTRTQTGEISASCSGLPGEDVVAATLQPGGLIDGEVDPGEQARAVAIEELQLDEDRRDDESDRAFSVFTFTARGK